VKTFPSATVLHVGIDFGSGKAQVGRLASRNRRIYFEYSPAFIEQGIEISPFMLPVKAGVTVFDPSLFEGLTGVFYDSLPDGWGRLLLDRFALSKGIMPAEISPLDRLAFTGSHAPGALVYEPEINTVGEQGLIDLDGIAAQVREVLEGSVKSPTSTSSITGEAL